MRSTRSTLLGGDFPRIHRDGVDVLQVNLGYRCNQRCAHCHVAAGPDRTEQMPADVVRDVVRFLAQRKVGTLDLTGGAPELHPLFRSLVERARALGARVIDRCNLTVLQEPGQEDLGAFLARHEVRIVASLPCYLEENVDRQRGKGTYARSIAALRELNALGYGRGDPARPLDLVYNPLGASLPPAQAGLERAYKGELLTRHGVRFDRLLAMANMPIARFGSALASHGRLEGYLNLLRAAHRDENLGAVMCRRTLSVDWQGRVFDCDFNQMLDLPLELGRRQRPRLRELTGDLGGLAIQVGRHCYGCTAGQGSSCTGALGRRSSGASRPSLSETPERIDRA